jgi:hypothetical protein
MGALKALGIFAIILQVSACLVTLTSSKKIVSSFPRWALYTAGGFIFLGTRVAVPLPQLSYAF